MTDKYWEQHLNNPINDRTDIDWCTNCQSNKIEDEDLCHECLSENYSECCGTELTGEYKDIRICPKCKEHI